MTAGGNIVVTFGAVAQAEEDVQATAASLNQQLADLKTYLQPLVSTWTGSAATTYQEKQARWDQAQQAVNDVLARIGVALGQAHANFVSAETTNQRMWA